METSSATLLDTLYSSTAVSSLSDHQLLLKKGFTVMMVRNIDPENGHSIVAWCIIEKITNSILFHHLTV